MMERMSPARPRLTTLALVLVALAACSPREPSPPGASSSGRVDPPRQTSITEAEAELTERIRAVVLAQRARLRACYEEGLAKSPALAGRVVLVLEVGQSGLAEHVFEARREGLGLEEVQCFARVLKSTRFHDGAASAAMIQVPLAFAPEGRQ